MRSPLTSPSRLGNPRSSQSTWPPCFVSRGKREPAYLPSARRPSSYGTFVPPMKLSSHPVTSRDQEHSGRLCKQGLWLSPSMGILPKWNKKYLRFCSSRVLGTGFMSDIFLISWAGDLMYTFSLIPLIGKVLSKIKRDRTRIIAVSPA